MKRFWKQRRAFRHATSALVLGLAFLAFPYIVDVVFLGDLTPTHYAQETQIEMEDIRAVQDERVTSSITHDLDTFRIIQIIQAIVSAGHSDYGRPIIPDAPTSPHRFLTSASPISRPPPATID